MNAKPCIVCEEQGDGGIRIKQTYICASCEQNIIHTANHEKKYAYYMLKMKKLPIMRPV